MFQIGASLREARSRRGLSSADVQKAIRIRERYLAALEDEKWEQLPGEAYTKGFLRTYAEFLGLDGNLYIDEFNSRFLHEREPFVPDSLTPTRRQRIGVIRPLLAIAGVAVVVAAVAAWKLNSPSGHQVRTPSLGTGNASAATSTPKKHAKHVPATTKTQTQTQTTPAAPSYAVLSASRGACWLQVRRGGASGPVLYEQTLAQGATLRLSLDGTLWIQVGAPWNLDVRSGGKLLSGLPTSTGSVLLSRTGLAPAA